jgi:hypothetical protein
VNGHRFGWSGRPGIDRCRCGTLRFLLDGQRGPYWWFRRMLPRGAKEECGAADVWPCPKAAA